MSNNKKLCALSGVHVQISEHNNNGACPCLNCMGAHCNSCSDFKKLKQEILLSLGDTRCRQCQAHTR